MEYIVESMRFPVDNLVGLLIYAIIFMLIAGVLVGLSLLLIPNRIPYPVKSAIVAIAVFISLVLWWNAFIN